MEKKETSKYVVYMFHQGNEYVVTSPMTFDEAKKECIALILDFSSLWFKIQKWVEYDEENLNLYYDLFGEYNFVV